MFWQHYTINCHANKAQTYTPTVATLAKLLSSLPTSNKQTNKHIRVGLCQCHFRCISVKDIAVAQSRGCNRAGCSMTTSVILCPCLLYFSFFFFFFTVYISLTYCKELSLVYKLLLIPDRFIFIQ